VIGQERSLPPQAAFTLYRAAQEALTNVRKHALASRVDMRLEYRPDCVTLTISDNGIGAAETAQGFGLLGLRERVALLGGTLQVSTAPGQGFTLTVMVGACESPAAQGA
jgi:signal transduction histidine kinase